LDAAEAAARRRRRRRGDHAQVVFTSPQILVKIVLFNI
jgi:hypothetical protein